MAGALTSWDPFTELGELRTRFDRVFDQLVGRDRVWTPAIDVVRDDGNLVIHADLPGIKPEEVKIEVEDDGLTVSGEHREEKEEKREHYMRRERRYGSFSRSMVLPQGVKADDIEATCEDGVLEVTIPTAKAEEKQKVEIKPKAG